LIGTARSCGSRKQPECCASSRTSAYALARLWLDSGGTDGLPAVRIGRSIRIPAIALDRLASTGQLGADVPVVLPLRDAG